MMTARANSKGTMFATMANMTTNYDSYPILPEITPAVTMSAVGILMVLTLIGEMLNTPLVQEEPVQEYRNWKIIGNYRFVSPHSLSDDEHTALMKHPGVEEVPLYEYRYPRNGLPPVRRYSLGGRWYYPTEAAVNKRLR